MGVTWKYRHIWTVHTSRVDISGRVRADPSNRPAVLRTVSHWNPHNTSNKQYTNLHCGCDCTSTVADQAPYPGFFAKSFTPSNRKQPSLYLPPRLLLYRSVATLNRINGPSLSIRTVSHEINTRVLFGIFSYLY